MTANRNATSDHESVDERIAGSTGFAIPWRLNLLLVAAYVTIFALIVWRVAVTTSWLELALLAGGMAIVGNAIYSLIHEAEHRLLLPHAASNDALGVALALLFPAPFHLIRQGHLGHHRRNRSDDEAFDLYFANDKRWLKWFVLYGIITGGYWLLVVLSNVAVVVCPFLFRRQHFEFDRPSAAFMESLNPRYWRLIWLEGCLAIALHTALILGLGISPLRYLFVYFGFGFSWSAMQYVHHFGTERHVLRGARNLWLFGPIDWIWLHHNWHQAHHLQPTVPWIYLPKLAQDSGASREFLLAHYLKMWRGPRLTGERVENRYSGRVIQ